jgi:signal transduction histidine kinase
MKTTAPSHVLQFRQQVILSVAAALLVLAAAFLASTFTYLDQRETFETEQAAQHAYQIRDELIASKSVELGFLCRRFADLYAPHAKAMRARNRGQLEEVGKALFEELKRDFNIINATFIGPDRHVVLRLSRPYEFGDELKRDTLNFAALSGEAASGVEVDSTAIPVLRHVLPWYDKGERIGYVDLEMEIDSLVQGIRGILGVEIVSAVHKEYSNPDSFATGKARYGYLGNWGEYDNLVLLRSSLPAVPASLMSRWQKGTDEVFEARADGKIWSVSLLPLEDIGGRQSISLALLRDVSTARLTTRRTLGVGFALVGLLILALFFFLSWRTGRIEAHVLEAYDQLKASESELRVASEKAQAANVAKSQFLSTMRHELRTPLNGILGMAQLLEMEGVTEEDRKEFIHALNESGQNLLTLVNDILDFSQIEAGELSLSESSFAPVAFLDDISALFRAHAEQKGLSLETRWIGPPHSILVGDTARLRQMLSCLVGNAVKFSERGTIRVQADLVDPEQVIVEFSVSDQGIGIAAEAKAHLFQVFTQVDGSGTRRYGGLGLGLAIVRSLAEKMHGNVGVESQVGAGSRFWFRVRLARPADLPPIR